MRFTRRESQGPRQARRAHRGHRPRWAAPAAGACAAAVVIAGCGSGSGGGSGSSSSGTISVVMAQYSSKSQPYWTARVQRFEKQNPKITVNLRVIDWDTLLQQVPTMIQTRTYPDVLNFNAYSTFAASWLLRPAKDVLSPSTEADFESSFLGSDSIKGTQYGIPWIASVRALGYNKQAFSKAGITSPPAFDTSAQPELADIQYDVLATSESYATSHPAAVRQFLQAVESGQTALSQKQPAALKDIANIYSSGLSPSVIDDSATAGVDTGCSMPAGDWQAAAAITNKWGWPRRPSPPRI